MADPWTPAWEEAEATAPPGLDPYNTIELQHPAFLEGDPPVEIPIRAVTGVHEEMMFGIEPGARFGGGTMQEFRAIPFHAEPPEFAEGKTPECKVLVDGVARELAAHLDAAIQIKADLVAIFRQYRPDDLTEPCWGPIQFVMRRVTVTGTAVQGFAKLEDLANRRFPFKTYTINEFPGLLPP